MYIIKQCNKYMSVPYLCISKPTRVRDSKFVIEVPKYEAYF